ncbi:hypothetical protein CDIK_3585 [Cucumispora dikerogammari]|nr:hypothetical protein CDIK_3585 [Cucumispora dikerogammari]
MLNQLLSKLNFFNCQASIDSEINTRTNNRQKDGDESKNKKQASLVHDSFKFMNQVELDLAPFFNCCPGFVFENLTNELFIRLIKPGQEECSNSFFNYYFKPSDKLMESIKNLQVIIKQVEGHKYSFSIETKDEESKTRLKDLIQGEGKSFKLCVLFFGPKHKLLKKNVIGIIRGLENNFEALNELLIVFSNDINNKIKDFNKKNCCTKEKIDWIKTDFKPSLDLKINKVQEIECFSKHIKHNLIVYLKKIKCNYLKILEKNLTGDKREKQNKRVRDAWNGFVVETTKFIFKEIQRRCSKNSESVFFDKNFLEVEFKNKIVNFRSAEATFLKSLFSYMIYIISKELSCISLETGVFKFNRIIVMLQKSKNKSIMSQELTKEDKIETGVKDNPNISGSDTTTQTGSALNEKDTTSSIILTEEECSSSAYKKIKGKQTEKQQVTFSVNSLKQEGRSNKKDIIQREGITHEEGIVKEDEITHGEKKIKEDEITQTVDQTKTHSDIDQINTKKWLVLPFSMFL